MDSLDSRDDAGALSSATPVDVSPAGRAEPVALTFGRQLSLNVLWLGINAISAALLPIVLPIQILLYISSGEVGSAQQAEFLGWLSAAGAAIALLVPPLVGALSDRTTLAIGRRRPYIALGILISAPAAWAMAGANDLNSLAVAFLVLQLGFNVVVGAYEGLLPDLTPERQRGSASGYLGMMTILGNVGSLALAGVLLANVTIGDASTPHGRGEITHGAALFYGISTAVMVATALITIMWTREAPVSASDVAALRPAQRVNASPLERQLQSLRTLWLEPWKSHNFTWVFLTRALVMLGLTLFLTFIEYYFANVAHVTNFVSATAVVAGLALVGAVASAVVLGVLSDRMNRPLLVGVSTALMAGPAIVFVFAPANIPLWPLGIVFGLGYGAYTSVDWALAVDALPVQANAGKDLGIWSMASTLPTILAPALGGALISLVYRVYHDTAVGYRSIFALAAVSLALGALFVSFIRGEPTAASLAPRKRRPGMGWRLAEGTAGGRARGFLRFWPIWEWVMGRFQPKTPIPHAPHGLLHVYLGRYSGKPITLPDGTHIERGARVAHLHFDNLRVSEAARDGDVFAFAHMVVEDMRALAAWVAQPGEMESVQALFGLSLIGRAAPRLGFTIRERPVTLVARLDRFFMDGLLALYNPAGLSRLGRGGSYSHYPVEIWMSRAELLRRYGSHAPAPAGTVPAGDAAQGQGAK